MINKELINSLLAATENFTKHNDELYWIADRFTIQAEEEPAKLFRKTKRTITITCYMGETVVNTLTLRTDSLSFPPDILNVSGFLLAGPVGISAT